MSAPDRYYLPLKRHVPALLPGDAFTLPNSDVLDRVWIRAAEMIIEGEFLRVATGVLFEETLEIAVPGLDAVSFSLGNPDLGTEIPLIADLLPRFKATVGPLELFVNLDSRFLVPVEVVAVGGRNTIRVLSSPGVHIPIAGVSVSIDLDGNLDILGDYNLSLPPVMIGETGIVLSAENVRLVLSEAEAATTGAGRGLSIDRATILLPEDISVVPTNILLEECLIGAGGFSGRITGDWTPSLSSDGKDFTGDGAGDIFGIPFALDNLSVDIKENVPIGIDVRGSLILPYFEQPIAVRLNLLGSGAFTVTLLAAGFDLTKQELLTLNVRSLSITKGEDNIGIVTISGGLTPLLMGSDGMKWPSLEVKDLSIDTTGKFSIAEAWMDLNEPATLDLWGFKLELARLGIGTDESDPAEPRMWLNLSGSLRLMEQLPVGLGIEGFKLSWPQNVARFMPDPPDPLGFALALSQEIEISFAGVELFYGIPEAVEFTGLIRFFKDAQIVGFAGDMALRVPASGFGAEAGLLIGFNQTDPPYPFLYLYFGVELPAGIPLGQSGLALKAAMGMFGINVSPDKTSEQNWYYDWYKRGPIVGAHPTNKWKPAPDALALGVGVTITTADGYVKGTRGLLVLSLPGPVLMIEGRALVLDGLSKGEPPFRALAVFDGNEGTVQLNIEAEAELVEDVVEAYAMMEAFFDFNDVTRWHLYLGQDQPEDRRIRANILKFGNAFLFKADAYLMLDMVGAETLRSRVGVFVGFKPSIPDIGPVKITLEASLEGKAEVTVRPEQFSGEINLEGTVGLSVGPVGLQVGARAGLATDGPLPFQVEADVEISADLPWPLDPFEATVHFEWSLPAPPQIEAPLSQVALGSRFSSQGQALSATGSEEEGTALYSNDPAAQRKSRAERSPVVAMDSQVVLDFTHEMNSPHFARHPDGEEKAFDVGYFNFIPRLTSVRVYECEKNADGTVPADAPADSKWKLIAAAGSSDLPLPGVWTAGSDPGSPAAPSARQVQLWTDNPLLLTRTAAGMAVALMLGSVPAGKPLAGRILDDYPDLMQPQPAEPERICITFEKWTGQKKQPGEEIIRRGVSFRADRGELFFQTADDECHSSQLEKVPLAILLLARRKLKAAYPELARDTDLAIWRSWAAKLKPDIRAELAKAYPDLAKLWEALFQKKKTCVCLVLTEDLVIHFPEPVSEVVIHLCRPAGIPKTNERSRLVTAKSGPEKLEEVFKHLKKTDDAGLVDDWEGFLAEVEFVRRTKPADKEHRKWHELMRRARDLSEGLSEESRCTRKVPVTISGSECEWTIRASGASQAFLCLSLAGMKGLGLCKVCWVTKADEDRAKESGKQAERNRGTPLGPLEPTFNPDCCYRIVVGTEVDRSITLPAGLEFLRDLMNTLDEALGSSNPRVFTQVAFFQTKSPPADLRPYVKWTYPEAGSRPHFVSEKVSVRFLRPHLAEMFSDSLLRNAGLKLVARDPSGFAIFPSSCGWSKAANATLFPEEEIWQDYRTGLNRTPPVAPSFDDVLTAEFSGANKLAPKTRYELLLVDERVAGIEPDTPIYFQTRFVTSAFDSFRKMVQPTEPAELVPSPPTITPRAEVSVESTQFLIAHRAYAARRREMEMAEVMHRFDRLESGRAALEAKRLSLRSAKALLEDKFRSLAMAISPERLFGKPAPKVELALIESADSTGVMGIWITAPESLDLESKTAVAGGDVVGRTAWQLFRNGTELKSPEISSFCDSSGRHLLLCMQIELMPPGNYVILFRRASRLPESAGDGAHWFDRPSLPLAIVEPEAAEIRFVVS